MPNYSYFNGTETLTQQNNKLRSVFNFFYGAGAWQAGGQWGPTNRGLLNDLALSPPISNYESFHSWSEKINAIIDNINARPEIWWDFSDPSTLTITGGRILEARNKGKGGQAYNLTNSVSADAPQPDVMPDSTPSARFTASVEWLETVNPAMVNLQNSPPASMRIKYRFFTANAAIRQVLFFWGVKGTNTNNFMIDQNASSAWRLIYRNGAGTQRISSTATGMFASNTTYLVEVILAAGLVTVLIDGIAVLTGHDYVSSLGSITATDFALSGLHVTIPPSTGLRGNLQYVEIDWP